MPRHVPTVQGLIVRPASRFAQLGRVHVDRVCSDLCDGAMRANFGVPMKAPKARLGEDHNSCMLCKSA